MFGLLKLWIELRIHKGGLEWGQLDLNLSKLHNPISITDNTTHFSQNNTNYTAPQKFFFGIVTEKFSKNWTQSIIPLVNETNFDYNIIMNSSNILALNIDSRSLQSQRVNYLTLYIISANLLLANFGCLDTPMP